MRNRLTAAFALTFAIGIAAACHQHPTSGLRADEYFYDCESSASDVQVFATDEAFVEFINKEIANGLKVDDLQAPKLLTPAPGTPLSMAAPPQVSFQVGAMAGAGTAGRACAAARPRPGRLIRAILPVGIAHAHCPVVTGDNYLFRVRREGEENPLYTAHLSVTSFTPGQAKWSKALAGLAGQTVVITVARAIYSRGTITNGPFVSSVSNRFTIGH
jgi:hypothetical protein